MVSKASEDLPEPLSPVITVKVLRAISTSIFLRLCWRAPCTVMRVSISRGEFHFSRLVVGCWLLAVGYWLLAIGYWLLADGNWLFAALARESIEARIWSGGTGRRDGRRIRGIFVRGDAF